MARPKAFITRLLPQEALDIVSCEADLEVWPNKYPPPPQILRQKVFDVEGILTNIMDRVDKAFLDAAPKLRVVSQLAAGLDNIDVAAATNRHIPVGYTPGVVSEVTADHTFALLLAAAHRVSESERWLHKGKWEIAFHPLFWLGSEVHHSRLGIVGMGKIGMEVAKRAHGFDMDIIYHSRTPKPEAETIYSAIYTNLSTLLETSDFVTLHVPLTSETRHLIGKEELRMMKPTAILVNTARGPVVDPQALHQALNKGWIAGAALDVTEPEPILPSDPLLTLENLVVTPHLGSATVTTRKRMAILAAQNLVAGLKGERLPSCANFEAYT